METNSRLIDFGSCYLQVTLIPKNTGMIIQSPVSQENSMASGGLRKRRCFHCHSDSHIRIQCPSLGKDVRQPLATIHDNSTGRSAKHHRRRLGDSTQLQSSFSPNLPAPSANRGELMGTSSGHSSIASTPSTEDILKRAISSIHEPAPSTSTSSAVSQRNDAMDLWENQLLLS
ncbi:unnamed protein product [Gordionus sp. m RMFG-2023]